MKPKRTNAASSPVQHDLVRRVVVENVQPSVDHGKFPVKRTSGEIVTVTADIFADGHDVIKAFLLYRKQGEKDWQETPMKAIENDVFSAIFPVQEPGYYEYTVEAWIDRFESWRQDIIKKIRLEWT